MREITSFIYLDGAYLDIKEIYGILRNKKIYSEYFKSLKPERALDLDHPMLFFYFLMCVIRIKDENRK